MMMNKKKPFSLHLDVDSFSSAVAGMKESTSRCRLKGFFLFIIMMQRPPYS